MPRTDALRNTLDHLALDPAAKDDRKYLVSMLRRLGYSEAEIAEALGGEPGRVIEIEYRPARQASGEGAFTVVQDEGWEEIEWERPSQDAPETTWPEPEAETAWPEPEAETTWPEPEAETAWPEPEWPAAEGEAVQEQDDWPAPTQQDAWPEAAEEAATEATQPVGFSVARRPAAPETQRPALADAALAHGWILVEQGPPPQDEAEPAWQSPAAPAPEQAWPETAPAAVEGAWPEEDWPTTDEDWPEVPAEAPEVHEVPPEAPARDPEPPASEGDVESLDAPVADAAQPTWQDEASWADAPPVAPDDAPETWDTDEGWEVEAQADEGWDAAAQTDADTSWAAPAVDTWDETPEADWPVEAADESTEDGAWADGAEGSWTEPQASDDYAVTEAPAGSWSPAQGDAAPFTYGEYTLHTRLVELGSDRQQRIYFFAKDEPKSGEPCPLPPGYVVDENDRTGLPFLRRDSPEEASQCVATTQAGARCRKPPTQGSQYCVVHRGRQT